MITIDIVIKEIRKEKNISLEKLEELTGINRKRLSAVENKKAEAYVGEIASIADALGLEFTDVCIIGRLEITGFPPD